MLLSCDKKSLSNRFVIVQTYTFSMLPEICSSKNLHDCFNILYVCVTSNNETIYEKKTLSQQIQYVHYNVHTHIYVRKCVPRQSIVDFFVTIGIFIDAIFYIKI